MGARHSLDKQSDSLNSPRSSFPTAFRVQASACSEFRVQASAWSEFRVQASACSEFRVQASACSEFRVQASAWSEFRVQTSACSEFRVQASACSDLRRHGHCSSPSLAPCSEIRDFIVIKAGTRPDPLQFGPGTAFPEHLGISLHRTLCRAAPLYVPVALPLAIEDSVQAPSISSARPVL